MPENDLCFSISCRVWNLHSGGSGLEVNERFEMPDCKFSDLAEIMGRFHELFETIRREREKK